MDNSGLAGRATPASGGKKAMPIELNDLRVSSEFLNLLLDNIDAAVLVADENLQVHHFNKSFFDLFDLAGTPGGGSFGQIAGCVNAVRENGACSKTSKCEQAAGWRFSKTMGPSSALVSGSPSGRSPCSFMPEIVSFCTRTA